jgi:DNA-binding LytR/AlgR family response regulator
MIQAFIIEDEPMARRSLENLLQTHFPYVSVIGWAGSVRDSLRYLAEHGDEPDVIFMDVELSDGNCFEIFRSATIKAEVIMTTAYDNYAVNAFRVRSLDYLLKPIEVEDMHRALSRILEKQQASAPVPGKATPVREKFLVHMGERIVPVAVKDIAYFYSEDKQTWLVTLASQRYLVDDSLEVAGEQLPAGKFFRISRSVILSSEAIESVLKLPGGRMKISPAPGIKAYTDLTVSRSRSDEFLSWLA